MTSWQWQNCSEPDLMLEELMGKVSRDQLVQFVRECWERIESYIDTVPYQYTVVEQFAAVVDSLSDHDAIIYASEAALKAAGWAPRMRAEQRAQADILRRIVIRTYATSSRW